MREGGGLRGPALCVVSGASRGLGRALSRLLRRRLGPGSALVLSGRSATGLRDLEAELGGAGPEPRMRLHCLPADLSSPAGLRHLLAAVRDLPRPPALRRLLLINNAVGVFAKRLLGAGCSPKRWDRYSHNKGGIW
uniref:Sepiapterin reductase n=1 Tax=Ornithorhynchus anatinus TaxID=9258 RepID=A0A6I8N438_ORNAN